jgi:hypothetical protein
MIIILIILAFIFIFLTGRLIMDYFVFNNEVIYKLDMEEIKTIYEHNKVLFHEKDIYVFITPKVILGLNYIEIDNNYFGLKTFVEYIKYRRWLKNIIETKREEKAKQIIDELRGLYEKH